MAQQAAAIEKQLVQNVSGLDGEGAVLRLVALEMEAQSQKTMGEGSTMMIKEKKLPFAASSWAHGASYVWLCTQNE